MSKLTIVANFKVKSDKIDVVRAELEKMIGPTRQEEGCLQYDLHQDNEDPAHFMFYENWESRELWQLHSASDHVQAYRKASEGMIEEFVLNEMTHIA